MKSSIFGKTRKRRGGDKLGSVPKLVRWNFFCHFRQKKCHLRQSSSGPRRNLRACPTILGCSGRHDKQGYFAAECPENKNRVLHFRNRRSSKCSPLSGEKYELIYRDCGNVVFDLYSFSVGSLRIFSRRSNVLNLRDRARTTGRAVKALALLVFYVRSGFES